MKFTPLQNLRLPSRTFCLSTLIFAVAAFFCAKQWMMADFDPASTMHIAAEEPVTGVPYVRPLWKVENLATVSGDIQSMLAHEQNGMVELYVGAGNNGQVFRFNAEFPGTVRRLS